MACIEGKSCLSCTQFFCLLMGFVGVILISFSLHHDRKWNQWVDHQFNLNQRNSGLKVQIDEYVDVDSQQEWIDLISRDLYHDKIYLLLNLIGIILILFQILLTCNNNQLNIALIAVISISSVLALTVAACFLIISVVLTDQSEYKISHILDTRENRTSLDSSPQTFDWNKENGVKLATELNCQSSDHYMNILRHCQMFPIKITAIIVSFVNATACAFVAYGFLSGRKSSPEISVESTVKQTKTTYRREKNRRKPDDQMPSKLHRRVDKNVHSKNISDERDQIRTTKKDIDKIQAAFRAEVMRDNSNLIVLNNRQDERNRNTYQPQIRGTYDDNDR